MLTAAPQLRLLLRGDEEQARAAQAELAAEGFDFLPGYDDGEDFAGYLARNRQDADGPGKGPGPAAHTLLVAVVLGELVGRVSLHHELTPMLAAIGGHISYGVRPAFRRRGHATALLHAALLAAAAAGLERVLVTCDETNAGSKAVIERCGGVYEDSIELLPGLRKLRYWIAISGSPIPPHQG